MIATFLGTSRRRATVLCSGGVDSSTLLYWLRERGYDTLPIGVDYGQEHARRELAAAAAVTTALGLQLEVLTIPSLARRTHDIPDGHYNDERMKAMVWPNRNLLLLSLACAWGIPQGATVVAYAAHGGDHAIYPDCRPEFAHAADEALRIGTDGGVRLLAPFIAWTKADIVSRAVAFGVPLHLTWSCYRGGDLHCGTCGTCTERREAFDLARTADPTEYAV